MKFFGSALFLLLYGCGGETSSKHDVIPAEPEYEMIYQTFEPVEQERSVTIDSGKENERALKIRSRFPSKRSHHGSDDSGNSVAFIDYQFAPHKQGEPFRRIRQGASLSDHDFKKFYFRIGNHFGGKRFKTTEELLRYTYKQVDSSYIREVGIAQLPMLLVDLGHSRHYFHRIADHRSLQIVIASDYAFVDLASEILQEIDNTLASVEIVDKKVE